MYKHEQSSSSTSEPQRVTQTQPILSEHELKQRIPLLSVLNRTDPKFQKLIDLLQEVGSTPYVPNEKYKSLFKIIEIGNLFEILYNTKLTSKTEASSSMHGSTIDQTAIEKELASFKLARNIAADNFHALYEPRAKELYESFSSICQGQDRSSDLENIKKSFRLISSGSSMKKILGKLESSSDKTKVEKLFCQMGYYLKKANEFFKLGNYEATAMAIIGAGNCARNFNISGLNPKKSGSITAAIYDLRKEVAHIYTSEREQNSLIEIVKEIMSTSAMTNAIQCIREETTAMGINIDMDTYDHQIETVPWPESPKAYDAVTLLGTAPADVVSPSSGIRINEERRSDSKPSANTANTDMRLTTTSVGSDIASVEEAAQGKRSRPDLISTKDDEKQPVSKKAKNDEEETMSKKGPG